MTAESYLAYVCSAFGLTSLYFYGRKSRLGPLFGLVAEIAWTTFAIAGRHWGLFPAIVGYGFFQAWNLRKYRSGK